MFTNFSLSWKEWRQRSRRQYQRAQQGRTGCIDVLRSVFGHKNSASRGYGVLRLLRKLICFGKGWLPLLTISRGDAVVKEMEKKHIARVDARMDKEREMQVKNSPQYMTIYRDIDDISWVETKQVKSAASDESSVFHDIAEKRFELRFPGAAHKQTNKQTKLTNQQRKHIYNQNKSTSKHSSVLVTLKTLLSDLPPWQSGHRRFVHHRKPFSM